MIKAMFLVGQCVRVLSGDPWIYDTHKIYAVGLESYLTERAIQTVHGWRFKGSHILYYAHSEQGYELVKCPDIAWEGR